MGHETEFQSVVNGINAAALDMTLWPDTLGAMTDLFGAVFADFEVLQKDTLRPVFMEHSAGINLDSADAYISHSGALNPRIAPILSGSAGAINYDYAHFSERELAADEFYSDFLAPDDLRYFVSGNVLNNATHVGLFALQRSPSHGHVDTDEIRLMERLIPHLQQALDVRFRLARASRRDRFYLEGLSELDEAAFLVDRFGRVLYENPLAERLCSTRDGVTAHSGTLMFADGDAQGYYARSCASLLLEEARDVGVAARNFPARRPSGARPYLVSMRPVPPSDTFAEVMLGATAILFIRDPEVFALLDAELLAHSYALTPAETELACAFDRGAVLADIADTRGVSITTVRTQLYSLMGKLAVSRQTDLTRLLRQYRRPG
jgi:DNA-binding CsgD family transcriptional regulator